MKEMIEFKQSIEVNDKYDVIVVGGGPSGCSAAAASARNGAKTLLIEATGCLGGMGTSGLVPAWCPFSDLKGNLIYRGIAEKVFRQSNSEVLHVDKDRLDWVPIDPEALKRIYDELVIESGADILFNTVLSTVNCDNEGGVSSIILSNKSGLVAYKAATYVDCTGDADLAVWAGADYEKGDETGDLQPATLCFAISNVNMYHFNNGPGIGRAHEQSVIKKIIASGKYPLIPDTHACNSIIGPGTIGFNAGHIWDVDNTDNATISDAMILGRKMAKQYHDALVDMFPEAFAGSLLSVTAPLMGIRETRRIIGDYYLTAEELMGFKSFDDEICRNNYYIDIHHKIKDIGTDRETHVDAFYFPPGKSHGIPYRCLTPKGVRNVVVAGRSISTDRTSQGSTRVMPVCLAMGEAAGIAASLAAETKSGDVHKVDTDKLRDILKDNGAFLP